MLVINAATPNINSLNIVSLAGEPPPGSQLVVGDVRACSIGARFLGCTDDCVGDFLRSIAYPSSLGGQIFGGSLSDTKSEADDHDR